MEKCFRIQTVILMLMKASWMLLQVLMAGILERLYMMIIIWEKSNLCLRMKEKNSNKRKKNFNMTLTVKENLGSSLRTN